MKKIFVAVPCYTGMVEVGCCAALLANIRQLEKVGHEVVLHFETGNCYIPQARNMCVAAFLDTKCDEIIFVDSDLWFENTAFEKLIKHDKEVICGAYPYRQAMEGYPIRVNCNADGTPIVDAETGLIELEGGPTGLMKIQRNVLVGLRQPEWKTSNKTAFSSDVYAIFDTGLLRNDGQWWGEDYLFCLRCADFGIKIFCEPNIDVKHIGKQEVKGNYHKFLINQPRPE